MAETSAIPPTCATCGMPITDPQLMIYKNKHYHQSHPPEELLFKERRTKMARAISFIMVGTEERYSDWLHVADFFINQLRYELIRVMAGVKNDR